MRRGQGGGRPGWRVRLAEPDKGAVGARVLGIPEGGVKTFSCRAEACQRF